MCWVEMYVNLTFSSKFERYGVSYVFVTKIQFLLYGYFLDPFKHKILFNQLFSLFLN